MRSNCYFVDETPTFTFTKSVTGTYTVRGYWGDTVTTGSVAGTSLTVPAPSGGWLLGWYRLYVDGAAVDAVFGTGLASINFCMVNNDARFGTRPAVGAGTDWILGGEYHDIKTKGWLGFGTARLQISDAEDPEGTGVAGDRNNLATARLSIQHSNLYWTNPVLQDGVRDRPLLASWPGAPSDQIYLRKSGGTAVGTILCKDGTIDGATIGIAVNTGTSSGVKIIVSVSGTPTESYDNLADINAINTALLASSYVRGFKSYQQLGGTDVPIVTRTVTDGVTTSGSPTITSATAAFTSADVGQPVSGAGIPNAARIRTVTNSTTAALGTAGGAVLNATATASGVTVRIGAGEIGSRQFDGIGTVVADLYPRGVHYFEGPINEPDLRESPLRFAHDQILFGAAVKAGHPDAKAMGPSAISIEPGQYTFDPLDQLLGAAASSLDALAFHPYGSAMQMALGRTRSHLRGALDLWALHGHPGGEVWQTEQGVITPRYRVYHPRDACQQLQWLLMCEEQGLPFERNIVWYDVSHGFWGFPAWWQNGNKGLNPQAPMMRTMAEEMYGKLYAESLDFGVFAELVVGLRFEAPDGSQVVALFAQSDVPDRTAVFTVSAADDIDWVDCFGNPATATVVAGRIEVPVGEEPSWLRLPAGVTLTPVSVFGVSVDSDNLTPRTPAYANDGEVWVGALEELVPAQAVLDLTFLGAEPQQVGSAVACFSRPYSKISGPLELELQTSDDGETWTTRDTKTVEASSFLFGSNSTDVGCARETYWNHQHVFAFHFSPVVASHVRLLILDTSWGGAIDEESWRIGDQSWSPRYTQLNELMVFGSAAAPFTSGQITITVS